MSTDNATIAPGSDIGNGNGKQPCGAVLVCGAGVAGIQASLDLSAAGFRVYLVEESPTIGGGMARLDKTFPTGDCATCIISPKLVECMRELNIKTMTMADVLGLEGEAGNFRAKIRLRPRSVDAGKCTGCGDCWEHCPVYSVPQVPEPFQPLEPLDEVESTALDEIVARHRDDPGAMMPVLQEISETHGYLPRRIVEHAACRMEVPLAEVLRVASFYDEFRLQPGGRHVVEVCTGTSCHAQGSVALLDKLQQHLGISPGETDRQRRFTLRTVRCLGLCGLSPAMKIDGRSFARVDPDNLPQILEQFA